MASDHEHKFWIEATTPVAALGAPMVVSSLISAMPSSRAVAYRFCYCLAALVSKKAGKLNVVNGDDALC